MESITQGPKRVQNSDEVEEFESSALEKLMGIFVEPVRIFKSLRQFGPRVIDWLIPILFFLVTLLLADLMISAIPSIRYNMLEKQAKELRYSLDPLVEKGIITSDNVNNEIEKLKKRYDEGLTSTKLNETILIVITELLKFAVVFVLFQFLLKFLYSSEISWKNTLVALGLPMYIKAFGNVALIMTGLITSSYYSDLSIASFASLDRHTTTGFLLGKFDLFSIWYFLLVAIGFFKLHNLKEKYKIFVIVFSAWLASGLFFFWISKLYGIALSRSL